MGCKLKCLQLMKIRAVEVLENKVVGTLTNWRVRALPIATKVQIFEKSSAGQTKHSYLTVGHQFETSGSKC